MTVNSDIGCSYISEQWRKTISLGAYKLKLVMTLSELLRHLVLHNKCTEGNLMYGLSFIIGHFTVMDGSEADSDLVLVQTFLFYYVNQVVLMLTSIFQGQFP